VTTGAPATPRRGQQAVSVSLGEQVALALVEVGEHQIRMHEHLVSPRRCVSSIFGRRDVGDIGLGCVSSTAAHTYAAPPDT
jgi:hypothetical protein